MTGVKTRIESRISISNESNLLQLLGSGKAERSAILYPFFPFLPSMSNTKCRLVLFSLSFALEMMYTKKDKYYINLEGSIKHRHQPPNSIYTTWESSFKYHSAHTFWTIIYLQFCISKEHSSVFNLQAINQIRKY